MNETSLYNFLRNYLAWELSDCDGINTDALGDDLGDALKSAGFCQDPYLEYDKALICPINKRHEKYCGCTLCPSHKFCEMLRKEGYV